MTDLADKRDAEHGYRTVGGKAFRLQQWAELKDQRDFDALVNRLRASKHQREVYADGGERLLKLRARKTRWDVMVGKARRHARARAAARVVTCRCGALWCPLPTAGGAPRLHCSLKCQRAAEWERIRDKTLAGKRKPCRGCGGPKAPGSTHSYCEICRAAGPSERGELSHERMADRARVRAWLDARRASRGEATA